MLSSRSDLSERLFLLINVAGGGEIAKQTRLVLGQRSILVLGVGSAWRPDHAQYRTAGEVAHVLGLFNCRAIICGISDEF
jgi:hypothetical protein